MDDRFMSVGEFVLLVAVLAAPATLAIAAAQTWYLRRRLGEGHVRRLAVAGVSTLILSVVITPVLWGVLPEWVPGLEGPRLWTLTHFFFPPSVLAGIAVAAVVIRTAGRRNAR